jgi:aryl-alcohol dehydrogenase-like predicted oxidoreductase
MSVGENVETRQLGNSDMQITPVGFGAWALGGGDWQFAWGDQDDQESIDSIHRALDMGINWIDTAAVYGLGHSEEVVGKALAGRSDRPFIFTKCSRVWNENRELRSDLTAESVRRECEASLRRLGVDVIDLYQIHRPADSEAETYEGWETLARLQEEGKVRWIGLSNFTVEQMQRAIEIAPITSLQPPYSAIRRDIEQDILPFCLENNIGVIVYSPMQAGLLTGTMSPERVANLPDNDWRKRNEHFQEPRLSRNLALSDLMEAIGERHGRTAGEVAIAWTLNHPGVTAAIVGIRKPSQVDGVIGAQTFRLSQDEVSEIGSWLQANP